MMINMKRRSGQHHVARQTSTKWHLEARRQRAPEEDGLSAIAEQATERVGCRLEGLDHAVWDNHGCFLCGGHQASND